MNENTPLDKMLSWSQEQCELFNEQAKLFDRTSIAFRKSVHFHNSTDMGQRRIARARTAYPDSDRITLPPTSPILSPFDRILGSRQSARQYSHSPMGLNVLSAILASLRVRRRVSSKLNSDIIFGQRSYPAAGGIFAIDFYVLPLNASGLAGGVFHYDPNRHDLAVVNGNVERSKVEKALGINREVSMKPGFAIIQTINIERIVSKYQQRGYRFALIEAGLGTMVLCQTATALGLGSLVWGAYKEHLLDPLIDIDCACSSTVNVIFVGRLD